MAVLEGGGPVGASISAAKSAKFSAQVAAGRFKEVGLVPSFFFFPSSSPFRSACGGATGHSHWTGLMFSIQVAAGRFSEVGLFHLLLCPLPLPVCLWRCNGSQQLDRI